MDDGIVRAISSDGTIRSAIASTAYATQQARLKHNLSYTATAALGRALTGVALINAMAPKRGQVIMKFDGNGPLGKVIVESSLKGTVRGYVQNPHIELPLNSLGNFDVGQAVGNKGFLNVSIDYGFGTPYSSTVELVSGEIGEDINHYLVTSQQTGSLVILGTHLSSRGVEAAGGLIVQLLADYTEETICKLENNICTFGTLTFLMRRGMSLEDILRRILDGFDVQFLTDVEPLNFSCSCTNERFIQALKGLPKKELLSMAFEDGEAEGRCHFCNSVYHVAKDSLIDMAKG